MKLQKYTGEARSFCDECDKHVSGKLMELEIFNYETDRWCYHLVCTTCLSTLRDQLNEQL